MHIDIYIYIYIYSKSCAQPLHKPLANFRQ